MVPLSPPAGTERTFARKRDLGLRGPVSTPTDCLSASGTCYAARTAQGDEDRRGKTSSRNFETASLRAPSRSSSSAAACKISFERVSTY